MAGNAEADRQVPMFGRGRIDHLALQAASFESFTEIRSRHPAVRLKVLEGSSGQVEEWLALTVTFTGSAVTPGGKMSSPSAGTSATSGTCRVPSGFRRILGMTEP